MSNLVLYVCTVLVWGSTWLAIKFQLGSVAPAVSVAWRFALAAGILFAVARVRGLDLRYPPATHAWLALHGTLMYGANYILVYLSEQTLTSGLVAVAFSLIIVFNILFLRVFFRQPVRVRALAGAACGIAGVALLFWPELSSFSMSPQRLLAVTYCLAATIIASLGNMSATRNHRLRLALIPSNAWAMLYGALFVAACAAIDGERFSIDLSWSYLASLAYLALFGSVLAFLCYLTLLARIGADRAGYSGIAIPVVAMLISALFEQLHWDPWIVAGMALCVAGNLMTLRVPRALPAGASASPR
jgi:drug/metabolite transporter (DMT)-like permease